VIVIVEPPLSVIPVTVITCPETPTVPVLAVVQPALPFVVEGALQPLGTVSSTAPVDIPPVAAVYVKMIVLPVWEALAFELSGDIVPEPSAALTVMLGELASAVSVPLEVAFCRVDQVCVPVEEVAVAPVPVLHAPLVAPYVIVIEPLPASVTPLTVMT
jgi:hypothetical protein